MKKIFYVLQHDAPYNYPVANIIAEWKDVKLQVCLLYKKPINHEEWEMYFDNKYISCFPNNTKKLPFIGDWHIGVTKIIKKFEPDLVIVNGYMPVVNALIIVHCILNKIKYIYGFDSISSSKYLALRLFQKAAVRYSEAVFINGKKTIEYMKSMNLKYRRIIKGLYCLDFDHENRLWMEFKKGRDNIRSELNISNGDFVVGFVGKLIRTRNISKFIEIYIKSDCTAKILIIGDGEESYLVGKLSSKDKRIVHTTEVPYEKLYKYYAAMDAYIHPGEEPYSLALIQAIIAELPILTSYNVGAAVDYVVDGYNGYISQDISKYPSYINEFTKNTIHREHIIDMKNKIRDDLIPAKIANELITILEE